MKKFLFLLLLSPYIIFCYPQSTIEDLESEIKNYQHIIDLNMQKIDSVKDLIADIKAEGMKDIVGQGVPFAARVITTLWKSSESNITDKICEIPKGDSAILIRMANKNKYEVFYDNRLGYVSSWQMKYAVSDDILAFMQEEWEAKHEIEQQASQAELQRLQAEQKAQNEEAEKARKSKLISKYGTTNGTKIFQGKIWIGMTDEMARESWGYPSDINRTVGTWGVHEQWVYDGIDTYLYFENDKLTSWQD